MIENALSAPRDEVLDAIRKATDPFGMDGSLTAAKAPSAVEVEWRLRQLGFRVVKQEDAVGWLSGAECGDVAITAAEGGIGYWSQIDTYDFRRWQPDYMEAAYMRNEVTSMNVNVPDDFVFYTIRPDLDDSGSYEGDPIDVTPKLIRQGVELFLRGVPNNFVARAFDDMTELGAMDANEADCVIQLGAFGELRYG